MRTAFSILCFIAIMAEVCIAIYIHDRKNVKQAKQYMLCLLFSCITIFSYVVSINTENYFVTSLFSSVYFLSIDWLLISFIYLTIGITDYKLSKFQKASLITNNFYAIFDSIVLLINPFNEVAIHYLRTESSVALWKYEPMFLYNLHLVFCYLLIFEIVWVLVSKMIHTPRLYRSRYSLIIEGLMFIVFLNCLFLYVPTMAALKLDISVLLYAIQFILIYYNATIYSKKKLLKEAPHIVLNGLKQPIVMFDYEMKYVAGNEASSMFVNKDDEDMTLKDFISSYNLDDQITNLHKDTSFQIPVNGQIYRCDYEVIRKKKVILAYVLTFTEASTEYDLMTGFHTYAAINRDYSDLDENIIPAGVLVCDVNRLTNINETYGRSTGDRVITATAKTMQAICPKGTYFARLQDAYLMAVVPNTTVQQMKSIESSIAETLKDDKTIDSGIELEYAFAMLSFGKTDINEAINSAEYAIKVKKLMDQGSTHSSLLFSLMRIMQESDPGTRQHVIRTSALGEKFAHRLGLTDEDGAKLTLLCILHDIGKLGIPLEILNKPDKLTNQEWELLKTHTTKGYEIAKASQELKPIANMILHHHEWWDGTGYPGGLAGEEIPVLCRIISIIDAYDAMIYDRPYHKAVSRHQALTEIEKYAGKMFDPFLSSEFIEMIKQEESDIKEDGKTDADVPDIMEEYSPLNSPNSFDENSTLAPVFYSRYVLTTDETIIAVDDKFEEMTGYSQTDIDTGLITQNMLVLPDDQEKYNALKVMMMNRDKQAFIEHKLRMKDGTVRNVFCHGWLYFDSSVKEQRVMIEVSDISESLTLKKLIADEKKIARHNLEMWKDSMRIDTLTGILNRTTFRGNLQTAIMEDGKTIAVLMCDLDNFKKYNDTHGHIEGDSLLRGFANILSENVSDNGLVCRMGGDEFAAALYFDKSTSQENVYNQVMSLWKNVDSDLRQYDKILSVSMGVTYTVGNEKNFSQLYKEADDALYKAKKLGKRQLVASWNM